MLSPKPSGFPLTQSVCVCFLSQIPVFFHIWPSLYCFRYPVIVTHKHKHTQTPHHPREWFKLDPMSFRSGYSQVMPRAGEPSSHFSAHSSWQLPQVSHAWLTQQWKLTHIYRTEVYGVNIQYENPEYHRRKGEGRVCDSDWLTGRNSI